MVKMILLNMRKIFNLTRNINDIKNTFIFLVIMLIHILNCSYHIDHTTYYPCTEPLIQLINNWFNKFHIEFFRIFEIYIWILFNWIHFQ